MKTDALTLPIVAQIARLMDRIDPKSIWTVPQNQLYGVTATMIGYHLDNSCGDHIDLDAIQRGFQEYVLCLETMVFGDKSSLVRERFNMASLIAVFRGLDLEVVRQRLGGEWDSIYWKSVVSHLLRIREITKECRPSMHEPDEQSISLIVEQPYSCVNEGYVMRLSLVRYGDNKLCQVDRVTFDIFIVLGLLKMVALTA